MDKSCLSALFACRDGYNRYEKTSIKPAGCYFSLSDGSVNAFFQYHQTPFAGTASIKLSCHDNHPITAGGRPFG